MLIAAFDKVFQDLDGVILGTVIDKDELKMRIRLAEHRLCKLHYIFLNSINRSNDRYRHRSFHITIHILTCSVKRTRMRLLWHL